MSVLEGVKHLLKDLNPWSLRWRRENIFCQFCIGQFPPGAFRYADQTAHHPECRYVGTMKALGLEEHIT